MRKMILAVVSLALMIGVMAYGHARPEAQSAGRAAAPPAAAGGRGEGRGTVILQQAPSDRAVPIPLETLKGYYADMDSKKLETLRMLEGGRFNVNIRRIRNAESALVHPVTADVWVVTEGSGTLTVNGRLEGNRLSAATRGR